MDPLLSSLIGGIVDDYFDARTPVRPNPKLVRGVARITSSLAEERLADYLLGKHVSISKIYLDQGINVEGQKLYKPDLVVCIENEIRVLVDVKMDLGHVRKNFHEIVKEAHDFIGVAREAKECTASIRTYKADLQKEKIKLTISDNVIQVFMIISGGNISPKQFEIVVQKSRKFENTPVITLLPGDHANDQKNNKKGVLERLLKSVDIKAMECFDELIRVRCNGKG